METIQVVKSGSRFIARASYEQREIPKGAGFRWDPAAKCWYTTDAAVAARPGDALQAMRKTRAGGRPRKPTPCPRCKAPCEGWRLAQEHCRRKRKEQPRSETEQSDF